MENKDIKEEETTKYWLHYFRRNDIPQLTEAELDEESEHIYGALMQGFEQPPVKVKRLNYGLISAAAAALLVVGASLVYFIAQKPLESNRQVKTSMVDAVPGKTAATLILAGGERIQLSNVSEGKIAEQSGAHIFKAAQNKLVYQTSEKEVEVVQMNTVLTAKGEQYSVDLPDGTTVWLNAASSLKFPTAFNTLANRTVVLTGEAYFEVAKDRSHPFIVKTANQEIKVLGTHFNVSSYADEEITKTTLLEGSVKVVSNANASVATLKPGEQSQLSSGVLKVKEIDLTESIAWKNGDFNFENEEFSSILNQVSRWYNVEIIDKGNHDGLKLSGIVSRSKSLSTVLKSLESTADVKFKIEGRKVTVLE
ncbi:MAG TPA: FecR domain-containing protein [Pedobacter sp.]